MKQIETRAVDFGDLVLVFRLEVTTEGTEDPMTTTVYRVLEILTPQPQSVFNDGQRVPSDQAAEKVAQLAADFSQWEAQAGKYEPFLRDTDPRGRDLRTLGRF